MILKTAICDDEKEGVDRIEKLLESYYIDTGIEFSKNIFNDPDDLLKTYTSPGVYDIVFLDVEMPINGVFKNGIDIAKAIRNIPDNDVRIIYISNYPAYMQMSFDVQASQYLDKNVSYDRFHSVMDTIILGMSHDSALLRVKTGPDQWNLIRIADIICICSFRGKRDKIAFCTSDREYNESGRNIYTLGEALKDQHFVFANKNCLVNMRHVIQFTHNSLQLSNLEYIEISRHFRKQFVEQFSKNILIL